MSELTITISVGADGAAVARGTESLATGSTAGPPPDALVGAGELDATTAAPAPDAAFGGSGDAGSGAGLGTNEPPPPDAAFAGVSGSDAIGDAPAPLDPSELEALASGGS